MRLLPALLLVLLLASSAFGQKGEERDGGVFFEGEAIIALLEALRDADAATKRIEALLQEGKAREGQVAELEASKRSADVAIAKADHIIENWKLVDDTRRAVVDEYKTALQQVRETNKQLAETVKQVESARWWDRVWSTISVIVITIFALGG